MNWIFLSFVSILILLHFVAINAKCADRCRKSQEQRWEEGGEEEKWDSPNEKFKTVVIKVFMLWQARCYRENAYFFPLVKLNIFTSLIAI